MWKTNHAVENIVIAFWEDDRVVSSSQSASQDVQTLEYSNMEKSRRREVSLLRKSEERDFSAEESSGEQHFLLELQFVA